MRAATTRDHRALVPVETAHRRAAPGAWFGSEVVRQVAEIIRVEGATELLTSRVPGDGGQAGFYERLGFVPTGDLDVNDEVIVRLALAQPTLLAPAYSIGVPSQCGSNVAQWRATWSVGSLTPTPHCDGRWSGTSSTRPRTSGGQPAPASQPRVSARGYSPCRIPMGSGQAASVGNRAPRQTGLSDTTASLARPGE